MRLSAWSRLTSDSLSELNVDATMWIESASWETLPPEIVTSSSTTSMSRMLEMLVRWHGSSVSSAATMALGSAFFDPRTVIRPSTGRPPCTSIVSVEESLGGAGGVMRSRC